MLETYNWTVIPLIGYLLTLLLLFWAFLAVESIIMWYAQLNSDVLYELQYSNTVMRHSEVIYVYLCRIVTRRPSGLSTLVPISNYFAFLRTWSLYESWLLFVVIIVLALLPDLIRRVYRDTTSATYRALLLEQVPLSVSLVGARASFSSLHSIIYNTS